MRSELIDEQERLRCYLEQLADHCDEALKRYELASPPIPPGLYWKARWAVGWTLRWMESVGLKRPDPWPVALKHVRTAVRTKPVLIWAVGTKRAALRRACSRFTAIDQQLPGHSIVFVTDVPDFSYYSRLACLVEYLPNLSGEGRPYEQRKASHLARLYQNAPVVPVSALLDEKTSVAELGRWIRELPGFA